MSDVSTEDTESEEDRENPEETQPDYVWTSDAALSLLDARELASRRGAVVVMLLAEVGVGKTTLVAELWTEFLLEGRVGQFRFGGSNCVLAFEERCFESRLASRLGTADTKRTAEEDDGFLHLRVQASPGPIRELFLADVTGEHFRSVREGIPLRDELPWVDRVDRFAILWDGEAVGRGGVGEVALNRTKRLLLALRESAAASPGSRVAVVMTKDDATGDGDSEAIARAEASLLALAREIDSDAISIRVAARPVSGGAPWGFVELLAWLCSDDKVPERAARPLPAPRRAMGRFRA